jgi:hypothetical protein
MHTRPNTANRRLPGLGLIAGEVLEMPTRPTPLGLYWAILAGAFVALGCWALNL